LQIHWLILKVILKRSEKDSKIQRVTQKDLDSVMEILTGSRWETLRQIPTGFHLEIPMQTHWGIPMQTHWEIPKTTLMGSHF